jgi:chaperonin cofactor prefoldin
MANIDTTPNPNALMGGTPEFDPNAWHLGGDDAPGEVGSDPLMGGEFPELKQEEDTDEDKGSEEPPAGTEAEPKDEPAEPTEIKIGDKTFTPEQLAELVSKGEDYTKKTQELSKEREAQKTELEAGQTYLSAMKTFEQSPAGAAQVIDAFLNFAKQRYGDAFLDHLTVGIDFDNLSDEGKVLNNRLRTVSQNAQQLHQENQTLKARIAEADKALEELKPVIENAKVAEAIDAAVMTIKRDLHADVTPTVLRKMIADTGERDPVKAFKLATYEERERRGYQKGYTAKTRTPDMPDANQGNMVDFDTMTADEIVRAMQKGLAPAGMKPSSSNAQPPKNKPTK